MSEPLVTSISHSATKLVELCEQRGTGCVLDFSRDSLIIVEEMAEEAAQWSSTLSSEHVVNLVQYIGCYLLENGQREFSGNYLWHDLRDQPVMVAGEPAYHVALMTWDKARGRVGGARADNLLFFYDGFAERARQAVPRIRALYP